MDRLARLVMHHRRIVSALWLALFIGGLFSATQLNNRWSLDFSLPGQPGDSAEQQLIKTFGVSTFDTYVAVVTVPGGQTVQASQHAVEGVFAAGVAAVPDVKLRIVDLASTGDPAFVTADGRTTYALIQAPIPVKAGAYIEAQLDPALAKAATARGFDSGLTSYGLLAAGGDSGGTGVLAETLLGGAGALLVLIFVFASFLALLPLLIAAVSILTTFILVLGLTTFTDVNIIVQYLIALIGLGVAIDYSLLLVSRWREERAHGRTNEQAVIVAMKTAGRAVFASGVTVAISLLALLVVPVPALRSMGIAGLLIPLVSVSAVLTLLPALLSSIGPRVDYPRIRKEGTASRGWSAWARLIVGHRTLAATVALAVLALLIIPVFGLKIGQSGIESLARNGARYDALQTLTKGGVGTGVLTPMEILVPASDAKAAAQAARGVDGVQLSVVGTTVGDSAVVDVLPTDATVNSSGTAVVDRVRAAVQSTVGHDVGLTGVGAAAEDYSSAVYDKFPYVLGAGGAHHLRAARAHLPIRAPATQGRRTQPGLHGGSLRPGRLLLAARPRVRRTLQRVGHGRHQLLAACRDLRVPVRPVDGLRGVHLVPHAGGVRPYRRHLHGRNHRHRSDRPTRHLCCPYPLLRLLRARLIARRRRQDHRNRPRCRHPHRRHHRPRATRASPCQPVRPMELVVADLARKGAVRGTITAGAATRGRRDSRGRA